MAYDHFPLSKIHSNKTYCLWGFRFSIRKSIRIPRAIDKHLHPGLLQCKITVYFIILSNVLKSDKLEWAFKIFEIFLTFEWTSFEPKGIYDHRVNKQMCIDTILGQNMARLCQQCSLWTAKYVPSRCCSYYKIGLPNLCRSRLIALKKLLNI